MGTRPIVGCTPGGYEVRACLSADQSVGNLLESSGAAVKRSRLEERNGIWLLVWTLEYLDLPWNHVEMKRYHLEQFSDRFQRYHRQHLRHNLTVTYPKCVNKECMRKTECKAHQDAWEESRQTAAAEEAKRGVAKDPDSRPLNPSSSSMDPEPKRTKTATGADAENAPDQMDVDRFQRTPANAHPLEPASDENSSKKAKVARSVLHIRGESEWKFDVNEEAWPNADLAIHSSNEGALIDGLPADKVKAGDEREIRQMKDLQLNSWVKETDVPHDNAVLLTGWARRMKGNEERSRCVLKDFATRSPKGQERDGWIWRLHGAMNGLRTASRDLTEFLAGIPTKHMGFKRGKLERCLFVHESNETRVVSHVDDPLICAKPATLEKFWMQITKMVVIKRGEALNPCVPVVYLGFEYQSVHEA